VRLTWEASDLHRNGKSATLEWRFLLRRESGSSPGPCPAHSRTTYRARYSTFVTCHPRGDGVLSSLPVERLMRDPRIAGTIKLAAGRECRLPVHPLTQVAEANDSLGNGIILQEEANHSVPILTIGFRVVWKD
jgi:hypothetical protein